jgi:hypothetical protein
MPEFVQERGHPLRAGGETGADANKSVNGVGKEPERRPNAGADPEVRRAVDTVAAGRLAALKKPGWPKVSRSFRSCEYDKKNPAAELASPVEMVWLFSIWPFPGYDPKPTSNVTVMLFVNVESRILMAVCSSWRKLLICA